MESLSPYKQSAPPSSAGFSFGERKGKDRARGVRLASRPAGASLPLAASVCPPLGRCGLPASPPSFALGRRWCSRSRPPFARPSAGAGLPSVGGGGSRRPGRAAPRPPRAPMSGGEARPQAARAP